MQVSVVSIAPEGILLSAPLAPNINHRETVFGGSAAVLATLAAWSLVHTRLEADGRKGRLVIQRNSMSYDQPIAGDFHARSFVADPAAWPAFIRLLDRRGRARITVESELLFKGDVVGRFEGDFVALRP
jgi:thioesterase domain-containing protein